MSEQAPTWVSANMSEGRPAYVEGSGAPKRLEDGLFCRIHLLHGLPQTFLFV
jgi:hypothetical protein